MGLEIGAQRVTAHVAGHDATNRLLAEVLAQETVELYGAFGRVRRDGLVAELECHGFVGGNVDVVHVDPAPVFFDGDGVRARLERDGCREVCPPGCCRKVDCACGRAVYLEVVCLEVARLVADGKRVLACRFGGDAREGD